MPVMLADSEETEAVELLIGGLTARFTTSKPPETLVVPEFCRLVTTAIARFGSTATAVGGPLSGTGVSTGVASTWPVFVPVSEGSNTVRSMEDNVFDPAFATSARA